MGFKKDYLHNPRIAYEVRTDPNSIILNIPLTKHERLCLELFWEILIF